MSKIKLTNPGMQGFTGYLGTVRFENGISVEAPSHAEMNRLAAITSVSALDDEGNEIGQVGVGAVMAGSRKTPAPLLPTLERGEPEIYSVEETPEPQVIETAGPVKSEQDLVDEELSNLVETPESADTETQPVRIYSQAELEEIADSKGISGLREIGNLLGVKDNSIQGLIKEIIAAQGNS